MARASAVAYGLIGLVGDAEWSLALVGPYGAGHRGPAYWGKADIKRLMRGERLGKPTVSELLEAASGKTVAPAIARPTKPDERPGDSTPDFIPSPA